MPSFFVIMLLALLFVTLGFIVGALIVMAWNEREKNRVQPTDQPDPKPSEKPRHKSEVNDLRVWHDMTNGKIMGEWEGHLIVDPKRLPADDRRKLVALAREWIAYVGGVTDMPTRPPLLQVERDLQAQVAPQTVPDQVSASEAAPAIIGSPSPVSPVPAAPMAVPTPAPLPPAPPASVTNPDAKEPKPQAPSTIVGQIDAILQEMLSSSTLNNRGIRLAEDPGHGVTVWIGIDRYDGIEGVLDPDVRAVIRRAVAEWERRSETPRR